MKKFVNWLVKISTGWVALAGLLVFLLFTILVLPGQASQAESYTGKAGSPDTSLFYSADQLYKFAERYGPQGREAYIRARLTFDFIWPLVYAAFLTTSISWLTQQAGQKSSLLRYANLVPFLGLGFDFLENISTSIVMMRFPSKTPILVSLAGYFTAIKWIFVAGSFLALFFLVILTIWNRLRTHSQ